jgi:tetratricopeptide (TPR) repeat protein
MGDYLGAEADLSLAVNAGRTDIATLYALGMSYLNLKEHAKAMATLTECIAISPDYAPALVGLAQANLYSGDKEQALSLLSRALQLGGGAEFTPAKIQNMINRLDPKETTPAKRSSGYFFAYAVHRHSFPLVWCKGVLTINNSVVEFRSNKPSHSFRIPSSMMINAAQSGNELLLDVKGEMYRFTIEGKTVREFLEALNP